MQFLRSRPAARWCRWLAVALFVAGMRLGAGPAPAPAAPNVLFILCDDLGIHDLHCYGRADHHTPNLDRLAAAGMRFTAAYCAQPICSPSRAALLTGRAPARLGLTTYLPGRPNLVSQKVLQAEIETQVPLREKMWPRYFQAAGYVCGAFGKWHVGGAGFGPLEHGFASYHPGAAVTVPSATEGGKGEYDLTTAVEQFMTAHRGRPWVAYLAHNSPHLPYAAQSARVAANPDAFEPVYAGVIETLDDTVGRLLAKLDDLGLTERTLVVFTSDNGGLHVPEGPHPRVTHNGPFRAGKGFLYEGGLRVPLLARWPGRIPAGRVTDEPVINTDWLPTLLELAGLPMPPGLDGVSFAPLLTGRGGPAPRRLFWHFPHYNNQGGRPGCTVRDGAWKLVEYYDTDEVELYDLAHDPGETRNQAAAEPVRTAELRAALAGWRGAVGARGNRPNPQWDPAWFARLYREVDPGRFAPATAGTDEWNRIWNWRRLMDTVPPVRLPDGRPDAPR